MPIPAKFLAPSGAGSSPAPHPGPARTGRFDLPAGLAWSGACPSAAPQSVRSFRETEHLLSTFTTPPFVPDAACLARYQARRAVGEPSLGRNRSRRAPLWGAPSAAYGTALSPPPREFPSAGRRGTWAAQRMRPLFSAARALRRPNRTGDCGRQIRAIQDLCASTCARSIRLGGVALRAF